MQVAVQTFLVPFLLHRFKGTGVIIRLSGVEFQLEQK